MSWKRGEPVIRPIIVPTEHPPTSSLERLITMIHVGILHLTFQSHAASHVRNTGDGCFSRVQSDLVPVATGVDGAFGRLRVHVTPSTDPWTSPGGITYGTSWSPNRWKSSNGSSTGPATGRRCRPVTRKSSAPQGRAPVGGVCYAQPLGGRKQDVFIWWQKMELNESCRRYSRLAYIATSILAILQPCH